MIEAITSTVSPEQTVSLVCTVNCSATLAWTFNGGSLPDNVQVNSTRGLTSSLEISRATVDNAGVYSCLAHSATEAYSGSAVLRVAFYGELGQNQYV